MKIRTGFVSNSSSSSFIIKKSDLTEKQIALIKDHANEVRRKRFNLLENEDKYGTCFDYKWAWFLEEDDEYITGRTSLTNFDMEMYLQIERIIGAHFYEGEWEHKKLIKHFLKTGE